MHGELTRRNSVVWQLDDLIIAVGSLNRGVVTKALGTWANLGVLREDPENTFVLLEHEEQGGVARDHARGGESYPLTCCLFLTRKCSN